MTRTFDTPLRCPRCHCREQESTPAAGPHATGLTNTRTYEGVKHTVAAVECGACGYSWFSRTKRALALARQAKQDDRTPPGGTGDIVLGARTTRTPAA